MPGTDAKPSRPQSQRKASTHKGRQRMPPLLFYPYIKPKQLPASADLTHKQGTMNHF